MPGWLDPSATRVRLKEAQEEEARAAFAAEMAELQASHERAREMLAEVKYELAWRRLCREFGYVPNEQLDRKWDGQPPGSRSIQLRKNADALVESRLSRTSGSRCDWGTESP